MHRRSRILVLRPDHIGDAILFSGALRHIRSRWPDARIDLCVGEGAVNLFERCPFVDRLVPAIRLFPWRWLRGARIRGAWRLAEWCERSDTLRLMYPSYELLICPLSSLPEEVLSVIRRMPSLEKWGVGGVNFNKSGVVDVRNAPEAVFTRCATLTEVAQWEGELQRLESFLTFCGINVSARECVPEFWLGAEDGAFAGSVIPEGPVLGLFPGAASRFRQWPVQKWREFIGRQAASRHLVVFGSSADCGAAREMLSEAPRELTCVDLTGRTTLRQLAACIKRCSWMVCMESAGLHMAVALGVPAVGLLGGHHYGRYYPWGDSRIHRVATHRMDCFRCNNDCIHGDYRCVSNITVDVVLGELASIQRCAASAR